MQNKDKNLIKLSKNSEKLKTDENISTDASKYSLVVDVTADSGSDDNFGPEEGRTLTREAGELRIKGIEFNNHALYEVIFKILDKVKMQEITQKRQIYLLCRILTLTSEYFNDKIDAKDLKAVKQELKETCDPLIVGDKEFLSSKDKQKFRKISDKIEDDLKKNYDKIDDFIEELVSDEAKKVMYNNADLDDLITKLFDEMNLDEESEIDHKKFNHFIDKILRKESREYIAEKLDTFKSMKQDVVKENENV